MPRPGPAAGFTNILHPQKRAVLRAFSQTHHVSNSCALAGISRDMHYHWFRTDPAYKAAFAEAREMAGDMLEEVATQRAIGTTAGYSDLLLIFLLKGAKPDKYRENVKVETDVTVRLESALQQGLSRLEVLRARDQRAS